MPDRAPWRSSDSPDDTWAHAVNPGARVCYVDNDPAVVRHAGALLAGPEGITAAEADLTDPAAVLGSAAGREVLDPSEPVCLIFALVLHFPDAGQARRVAAGSASHAAPGSALVISVGRNDDPEMWQQARQKYTAAVLHNHRRDEVLSFWAGWIWYRPG